MAMTWSGPNCAVKRPFARRQTGSAFARDRIEVRIERRACSPIKQALAFPGQKNRCSPQDQTNRDRTRAVKLRTAQGDRREGHCRRDEDAE